MLYRVRDYVDDVLRHVEADAQTRTRLQEDLLAHIDEAAEQEGVDAVLRRMGRPEALARELTEYLHMSDDNLILQLQQARMEARRLSGYEYRSRKTVLGIPLVHINLTRGRGGGVRVAKGIIAIGDVAVGLLAIGGVAVGGLSLGGVALGLLLALGGVAIGGLSLGGLSIGLYALGGCAVGVYAFGGAAAAARVAVGGYASGTVAIGAKAAGQHVIEHGGMEGSFAAISPQAVRDLILQVYPGTASWLLRLMTLPFL